MSTGFLCFSSITKKIIMSLAGLFLVVFLLVHLSINLLILKDDGGKSFIAASEFMSSNPLIKIMEIVLFGCLFIHMIYGVILTIKNWMSRPVKYSVVNKTDTSFFSRYMIYTGGIIFIFLAIHFMNFYFVKLGLVDIPEGAGNRHDFYNMVINLFSIPSYSVIYIILMLLLGLHLNHAFQAAFQTLGINHNKYTPAIKVLATIYSIIVSVGFSIIPLYFLLKY
ncbi:MAG: succinate dehydrogenase cytochrome b subunit [Bacteroidota bacterium]|nr:succinate dehydrogenase cytochrome b subunit [Bacteroidota bacterium]